MTTLTILEINRCPKLTPQGFLSIGKLMNLKQLTLNHTKRNKLDLSFIGELKNLEYLYLNSLYIVENSHLKIWKCLPKLTELYISGIDGIGTIGNINELKNIQHLELSGLRDNPSTFVYKISSLNLKNLQTLTFESRFYHSYRPIDFQLLAGINRLVKLRKIKIICLAGDKYEFYRIIAGLCSVDRSQELDKKLKDPKWSIAMDKRTTECILHRVLSIAC